MTRIRPPASPAFVAALAAASVLSGCGSQGEFPSLARRPGEVPLMVEPGATVNADGRPGGSAAPAGPGGDVATSQQPVSAELGTRLAQLERSAREAHARFEGKRARAGQLASAARGAAVASEPWAVATVAVADLESARSDAMVSLGELDRLYAAERIDGGDGGAIAAVRDKVTAWVADEDAVLADLAGRLKG